MTAVQLSTASQYTIHNPFVMLGLYRMLQYYTNFPRSIVHHELFLFPRKHTIDINSFLSSFLLYRFNKERIYSKTFFANTETVGCNLTCSLSMTKFKTFEKYYIVRMSKVSCVKYQWPKTLLERGRSQESKSSVKAVTWYLLKGLVTRITHEEKGFLTSNKKVLWRVTIFQGWNRVHLTLQYMYVEFQGHGFSTANGSCHKITMF